MLKYVLLVCAFTLGAWTWRPKPEGRIVNIGPMHVQFVCSDHIKREHDLFKSIADLQKRGKIIIDIKPSIAAKTGFTEYNFLIMYRDKDGTK